MKATRRLSGKGNPIPSQIWRQLQRKTFKWPRISMSFSLKILAQKTAPKTHYGHDHKSGISHAIFRTHFFQFKKENIILFSTLFSQNREKWQKYLPEFHIKWYYCTFYTFTVVFPLPWNSVSISWICIWHQNSEVHFIKIFFTFKSNICMGILCTESYIKINYKLANNSFENWKV